MGPLGVAKNKNGSWAGSGDTFSLLVDPSKRVGHGAESPLATQLQQAWLQTQLPKRSGPSKLDGSSPVPSPDFVARHSPDLHQAHPLMSARSSSSNFSQPSPQPLSPGESHSESTYTSHSDVSSVSPQIDAGEEPMEDDGMIQYLSDMLMDDGLWEKTCMYTQCSSYQAQAAMGSMTQELADLIGSDSPSGVYSPGDGGESGDSNGDVYNDNSSVDRWVDQVITGPQEYLQNPQQQGYSQANSQQPLDYEDKASSLASESICSNTVGHPHNMDQSYGGSANVPGGCSAADISAISDNLAASLDLECPYFPNPGIDGGDYANGRSGIESLEELSPLLMQCAHAVAADDVRHAHLLINQLRQKSSPFGDGGQRMTYYFVEALVARISGTGAQLYTALSSNRPSAHEMLRAYRMFVMCNPLPKVSHYFANATIYHNVEGSDRIHIIDFGILYGVQWPCLFRKLKERPGGPPHVRITGIDFAQPGFQKNDRVEDTGRRLATKAKQLGIEFEYHAIAGKWENIQPAQLTLRNDETLVVNCMFRLRNLLDETVMASSPRKAVLAKIHALNPKVFTMGVISAGYNSPFFLARFRETMTHYSYVFDSFHSSVPPDSDLRRLSEREVLGREILNIIACEGTERVERAEPYRQWQSRTINVGFKQQPTHPLILAKAHDLMKNYHRYYGIAQDGSWLVTGWKDRVLHALTAWVPA